MSQSSGNREKSGQRPGRKKQEPITWFDMIEDREKVGYLKHFLLYFLAVLLSAAANNRVFTEYQWWLVLSLSWGVVVLVHFFYLFVLKPRIVFYRNEEGKK